MKRSSRNVGTTLLITALFCSSASATAAAESTSERPAVQRAMEELAKSGAAGVQVSLTDGKGEWDGRAGVSELGKPAPVPQNGTYRIGSISKTMLSTVLLQLVDEGEIALDRPAVEHLPQFDLDPRITVRMLLQHTSGIFNYTGETNPDGSFEPGIPLIGQEFVDNRFRTYAPEELVRLALSEPARFEPGSQWSYSNTNYVLAALIVEEVTGEPYGNALRERVFQPVGMHDTVVPGTEPDVPGRHAHGYYGFAQGDGLKIVDVTRVDPSWSYGAGEVISTNEDLEEFLSALLDGKLMSPSSLEEMRKMRPAEAGQGYGLGLMEMDLGACGTVLGHTGGVPGYISFLFAGPDGNKRLEMSVTSGATDSGDPQDAARLQRATQQVVGTALCGENPAPEQQATINVLR
ncbi:serine hydrolase domain-containing protein [Bounagaea algeriensis]